MFKLTKINLEGYFYQCLSIYNAHLHISFTTSLIKLKFGAQTLKIICAFPNKRRLNN